MAFFCGPVAGTGGGRRGGCKIPSVLRYKDHDYNVLLADSEF